MSSAYFDAALGEQHEVSSLADPRGWAWLGFGCAYDRPPAP